MNPHSGVRRFLSVAVFGLLTASQGSDANAQTAIFEQPPSPRIANYAINVTLDDVAKRTHGDLVLIWNSMV